MAFGHRALMLRTKPFGPLRGYHTAEMEWFVEGGDCRFSLADI